MAEIEFTGAALLIVLELQKYYRGKISRSNPLLALNLGSRNQC